MNFTYHSHSFLQHPITCVAQETAWNVVTEYLAASTPCTHLNVSVQKKMRKVFKIIRYMI
jgi:hypothetical protein